MRANVIQHYKTKIAAQQAKLVALNEYGKLFHLPCANNYSISLTNLRYDLTKLKEVRGNMLKQLNVANANLYLFCKLCLEDMSDHEIALPIRNALESWKEKILQNNHFMTLSYATTCVQGFSESGYPFSQKLNKPPYNAIKRAFIQLPYQCKAFIKINIHVPQANAFSFLEKLILELHMRPTLFYYIEKVEWAKEVFPFEKDTRNDFAPLRILLDNSIVVSRRNPILHQLIDILQAVNKEFDLLGAPEDFSHEVIHGITVSQGFDNYKSFLKLIDTLDLLYDSDYHYAYLK